MGKGDTGRDSICATVSDTLTADSHLGFYPPHISKHPSARSRATLLSLEQ